MHASQPLSYFSRAGLTAIACLSLIACTVAQVPATKSAPATPTVVGNAAPTSPAAAALARAQADVKAGTFAKAVAELTVLNHSRFNDRDALALRVGLYDTQMAWSSSLNDAHLFPQGLPHAQSAEALVRGDSRLRRRYAKSLYYEGRMYMNMNRYVEALPILQRGLAINRQLNDLDARSKILVTLIECFHYLHRSNEMIRDSKECVTVEEERGDSRTELSVLGNLCHEFANRNRFDEELRYSIRALAVSRKLGDHKTIADSLILLGIAYGNLSEFEKAIACDAEALNIHQKAKNLQGEAVVLNELGEHYRLLSSYDKAIEYYQRSIDAFQKASDSKGEAKPQSNLGIAYYALGQYEKSIDCYNKALKLRGATVAGGNAETLNNLGIDYYELGRYDTAVAYYKQALVRCTQNENPIAKAAALGNLGIVCLSLHQYRQALDYFEQTVPIYAKRRSTTGTAGAYENIADAEIGLSDSEDAVPYLLKALSLYQSVGEQNGVANALNDLGDADSHQGDYAHAARFFAQALPLFRQVGDRAGEAATLTNLMQCLTARENHHRNPSLAIFYGKQAVNLLQKIRRDSRGLDSKTQQSYLKSHEETCRILADLLISRERLPEGQEILDLLKQKEYFDFVRRDATDASGLGKADLNTLEHQADGRIQAEGEQVTEAGTRYEAALNAESAESDPAKKAVLHRRTIAADKARDAVNLAFQKVLDSLSSLFDKSNHVVAQAPLSIRDTESLTKSLKTLDKQTHRHTVAVYTLVGEKTLRFLVYTGNAAPVAREYPIGSEALGHEVAAFGTALQNSRLDPRPLGKRLYDILMEPIAKDLAGANADEVMWSLDGALRYVPLAALWDGKQYLVEKHIDHSIFTPATLNAENLTEATKADWTVLAVGVTGARTEGDDTFTSLPGVASELSGIVKDSRGTTGIFPGTPLLDADFTASALTDALRGQQYSLVHIASHFRFRPGDEGNSYLLLGVGKLTLADVKNMPADLFGSVDLLTLSACDTALGSSSTKGKGNGGNAKGDGSEVESFGVLVQKKGAAAVLATLWPVADASTPALMQQFYRLRQTHPDLPKAEALQQAQICLLSGNAKPPTGVAAANRSELDNPPPTMTSGADTPPAFKADPAKPWAHPYYWAPFILIGNWK